MVGISSWLLMRRRYFDNEATTIVRGGSLISMIRAEKGPLYTDNTVFENAVSAGFLAGQIPFLVIENLIS